MTRATGEKDDQQLQQLGWPWVTGQKEEKKEKESEEKEEKKEEKKFLHTDGWTNQRSSQT